MDENEALAVLHAYRDARERLPTALQALATSMSKSALARESGLTREGVRRNLNRNAPHHGTTEEQP